MSEDTLTQRWRKPINVLATEDTIEWATADLGRPTLDYRMRVDFESRERFRLGYVCLNCMEPHEEAFPERCALCGYEMRARQPDDFASRFKGTERDPRAALIERELDRVDDTHERRFYETNSGIVVPASLKGK